MNSKIKLPVFIKSKSMIEGKLGFLCKLCRKFVCENAFLVMEILKKTIFI